MLERHLKSDNILQTVFWETLCLEIFGYYTEVLRIK